MGEEQNQLEQPEPGSYFSYTVPAPPSLVEPTIGRPIRLSTRRRRRQLYLQLCTSLLILGAAGVVAYFLFTQHPAHPLSAWLVIFAGIALCIGLFWLGLVIDTKTRLTSGQDIVEDLGRKREERAVGQGEPGEDVRSRNLKRIDEYNKIVWDQARGSYRNSQIAMSVGLALLVGGAIAAILESKTSAQLVVGGLAGLGGALSAYLGATFIRMYNEAINQMSYYYRQPLVHSYLLEAERMSREIREDARDEIIAKVIDATLAGSAGAGNALKLNAERQKRPGRATRRSSPKPDTAPTENLPELRQPQLNDAGS